MAASFLSVLGVLATLGIQMHQIKVAAQGQAEQVEAAQFLDITKSLRSIPSENISIFATATALRTYLVSPRFGQQARDLAVSILGTTANPSGFQVLFDDVVKQTNRANLSDIVRLSNILQDIYEGTEAELDKIKENPKPPTPVRPGPPPLAQPVPTEIELQGDLDDIARRQKMVGEALAKILRSFQPPLADVNLTHAAFVSNDLSGLDLSHANLNRTLIVWSNVKDADFGRVTEFNDSEWGNTQWWTAKKLSLLLLDYLKQKYAFDENVKYAGAPTSLEEYTANLKRLSDHATP